MKNVREIQLVELQILRKVKEVCEKNNLMYFLAYGTLLGAIRHNGFIPWDDDIDIMMPADDYLKFLQIAQKELGEEFFLQTFETDYGYPCTWAKVRKNNTTSMPVADKELDIHWGMCMDIFPMITAKDKKQSEKQERQLYYFYLLLQKEIRKIKKSQNYGLKATIISHMPSFCVKKIAKYLEKNILSNYNKNDEYRILVGDYFDSKNYKYGEFFGKYREACFEGIVFQIPSNAEELLSKWYGDYMQLPPENERYGHELSLGETIFDCEKDYKEYR